MSSQWAVAETIRWLAGARKEYCHACPQSQNEMAAMGPLELAVHIEHEAAERLADILQGENDAKGWLPSWRWDEWADRQANRE